MGTVEFPLRVTEFDPVFVIVRGFSIGKTPLEELLAANVIVPERFFRSMIPLLEESVMACLKLPDPELFVFEG